MTQYRFFSTSKLSFAIRHNGRDTYVNFGDLYANISRFNTTDKTLAQKIRKHRWFRTGLIKEETPQHLTDSMDNETTQADSQVPTLITEGDEVLQTADEPQQGTTDEPQQGTTESQGIRPEDVTSLAEAKDYLRTFYGAPRETISSRDKVAEFCTMNNIVFPNFDL